ncbi:hypothetical protein [Neisseria viridiae]|uniref:hypothetical protein n=1 Tax=Neisseria viridiae TaxID=2830648 RepID=UPI00265B1AEF|nr:hypothetical protein [Neisseria viridiae]
MPSEALSDGIFYCLCRFVPGRQCLLQHGILVPPFGFSDGIGGFRRHCPTAVIPAKAGI